VQKAQRKPKLSGYAQAAYGKPGLDIFSDDFSPFWQAGIRASWQIWDKGNLKRDQQLYQISYRQIELDKELFDRSLKLALDHYWYEITKDEQASVKDQEIMNIREAIKMVTESQFESGLITSSDLIQEVRLVEQARLQLELRKTRIQQSYTMIRVIRGEL
jgi:outer membrane protein TolC